MYSFKKLITGFTALSLLAGPALAQPVPGGGPYRSEPGPIPGPGSGAGSMLGPGPGPMPPHFHHHWQNHWYPPPPGRWRQGERFYGLQPIIIHNYGYYSLLPPPPGYYWVQSGDQFLMIAITSGIIARILTMPMH